MKKLISILVAFAMMAALCVCMAFAADTAPGNGVDPETGEKTAAAADKQSADAIVGKYFEIPEGVTDPGATFTYTFTPQASDTNNGGPAATYAFISSGTGANMQEVNAATTNDKAGTVLLKDVFKQAATMPDPENEGQTIPNPNAGKLVFTAPGEYVYEVTEAGVLNNPVAANSTTKELLTNDVNNAQKFYVRLYVTYDENNELQITNATIADKDGNKLDPTEDPTDDTGDDAFKPGDPKGGNFVNKYERKADIPGDDITTQNAALDINKAVTAPAGYVASNQKYPFTITLTKPANASNDFATLDAYIINGSTKTPTTLNWGANEGVLLGADDHLVLAEVPYGTTYAVEETLTTSSVPNKADYTVTVTGTDTATSGTAKGANGSASGLISQDDNDKANFVNKIDASDVTPTGILMNNLPYIVLALVAIGGLVAYVVVRRRQSDEA